ncbi:MAG: hypothetical protein V7K18_28395 [Nostoc sp.]|uniref:hypothetical protein n=1 Tax=Nostoc sp. TaxID=1180 RepID=UPI002FFB71D5
MTKKNLGNNFSPQNLDKFKRTNPKPRPEKLIPNLPAPLPNIDLPNIDLPKIKP